MRCCAASARRRLSANPARRRRYRRKFTFHPVGRLIERNTLLRSRSVVRLRVLLIIFFALIALVAVFVSQAQQTTDEGKPILKARAFNSSNDEKSPTQKPKTSPHKKKKGLSGSDS